MARRLARGYEGQCSPDPSPLRWWSLPSAIVPHPARAELKQDINLTTGTNPLFLQSQKDGRWASFKVGPRTVTATVTPPINIGRCGCLLTSLSIATENFTRGASPWYPHAQFGATGLVAASSFSPRYLDDFFNLGPSRETPWALGWGFLPGSGGTNCATGVWPWAASGLSRTIFDKPSGASWDSMQKSSTAWNFVDKGLLNGYPSIIIRDSLAPGGKHANVIVGWNNGEKKYLIFDPMWLPAAGARIAGDTDYPGATLAERYAKYMQAVQTVMPLEPASSPRSWLSFLDDPEPIELQVIDPRGRRIGHDPATGGNLQENTLAYYSEFTSFADPLGLLPEAEPLRYLTVANPEPGIYGLKVFGTGDGSFTLTLATSSGGPQENPQTITGTIATGEIKRYEVVRSASGQVTSTAVAAFAPRARAGNDAYQFTGGQVPFDGRGSFQLDGAITGYAWAFGDGQSATTAQTRHAYAAAGTYTATLTVTNATGQTATDDLTVVISPAPLRPKETIRVNVTSADVQGNADSQFSKATPDGRYVAFFSFATNLVPGDTNGIADLFIKDLTTGQIELVSVATGGAQADGQSYNGTLSADGRFVAFFSLSRNLATGVTADGIYVRDRLAGTTEVVAQTTSQLSSISEDGRYVAFSTDTALVPEDTNSNADIYVRDRQVGTHQLVGPGRDSQISGDGKYVAYTSSLGPGDTNGSYWDVYVRDLATGTTEIVSRTAAGAQIVNAHSFNPSISADGRQVCFDVNVQSPDMSVGNPASHPDVFVRDRLQATTEQVNTGVTDPGAAILSSMSANGRYVAFLYANSMAITSVFQVYLRDLQTGAVEMVSIANDSTPATWGGSTNSEPSTASNGAVVFWTNAPNLVAGDTNGVHDVFIRRDLPWAGGPSPLVANLGGPYVGWASSAEVPAAIRLDGSGSLDPRSRPMTARWDFGDGTPAVDAPLTTTHAYAKPGIYQASLVVSAGTDTSPAATTEVEVLPALPPEQLLTGACAAPGGKLSLEGAAILANNALVLAGWDRSTGPIPLSPAPITLPWETVVAPTSLPGLTFGTEAVVPAGFTPGSYAAQVMGGPLVPFQVPCATNPNLRPLAVAGGPAYEAQAGVPLTLDGSGSSDPENAPLTYAWSFGDESSGSGPAPAHTYEVPGTYMATLVVNDGVQDSATTVGTHSFAMVEVSENDGGTGEEPPPAKTGCGCGETAGAGPFGLGLALLLWAARRRSVRLRL
ncbi:MAG: PKD domain-containing protein [Myxococcaceae bacterium]